MLAHVRASKSPKIVFQGYFIGKNLFEVIAREESLFKLAFLADDSILKILERFGHMPLPPYVDRGDELSDKERKTVSKARRFCGSAYGGLLDDINQCY